MTNPISDLIHAECIFIIGSNLAANHTPVLRWIWEAKDRGAKVIVADPRLTPTTWVGDLFLQIRPGSDVALLNGMAQVIVSEGLANHEFIHGRAEGYEGFAASIRESTPQRAAEITGLQLGEIREAARMFARAGSAAIAYCMGITQHTVGTDNVEACANLALLTGNVGRPGTGVLPLRGQNNVQGACDMGGLPNVLPGYAPVSDLASRKRFADAWGVDSLPDKPGLTVVEMMNAAGAGEIRALWIIGEDPATSDPNGNHVIEALETLDFLVVQDIFLTETARMADLVLPAAAWAEKSGSFTNTERRVQWFSQAVPPLHETRSDLWIINQVGRRLGLDLGDGDPASVLAEINRVVPSYQGITRERASGKGGIPWPCPGPDHPGTPILHRERFGTPTGKGRFVPLTYRPPAESTSKEFPLVLNTGRLAVHYNAGTMTRRTAPLMDRAPGLFIEINPQDALDLEVSTGDAVIVSTARGRVSGPARVTRTVRPGTIFLPFHYPGVNKLTLDLLDEQSKIAEVKVAACRLEREGGRP